MEMCVIDSPKLKQIVMLFNKSTLTMSDDEVILNLTFWVRKSESYDVFKQDKNLRIKRIFLNKSKAVAAKQAGELLYNYLSDGYTCLGNFIGQPKPNISQFGVLNIKRIKGIGFYI
ncbi:hypothetical protein [Photobacterium carnosum]|jgi:hypothetical protein|uniref:hypothetical protein n=1 Tax=Photobacterium carnosum TaxID=2023717 RepID=UPI001E642761|nr:hypothetical protein [Photobacterium carnosum]MCD9496872.1 hypothetical protein [Photobacterium carnosum]MCD9517063.1 hypothetical protein [Photobacterium carnosum]